MIRGDDRRRFWSYVRKTRTCWLWTGKLSTDGYGQIKINGRWRRVHIVAYEWAVGAIPTGMELDHTCRRRNCVRPDHLEPKTHFDNMHADGSQVPAAINRRKVVCPKCGGPYTIEPRGKRYCSPCKTKRARERRQAGSS